MSEQQISELGDFVLFGFIHNFDTFLKDTLLQRLGSLPIRTYDFGPAGTFFFYNSYGDIAETEESIVLKLGFLRSPTMSAISARQLIIQNSVSPVEIDHQAFRGNGLVACFGKREPSFLVFKTVLSAPQLYYSRVKDDGILCATGLKPLVAILEHVELNDEAVVPQCLFGATLGPATHFRNISRLFPGELLKWRNGNLTVNLEQDLRFVSDNPPIKHIDSQSLDMLYERLRDILNVYLEDVKRSKQNYANLLSGGVDSSLVQLVLNNLERNSQVRSYSYAVQVPSFEREIAYAKQAVSIFDTNHTTIDLTEKEFPSLFIESTEILSQPVLTSAEVCKLGLAKTLSKIADVPQFLFVGQGADALFGLKIAQKLKMLEFFQKIPASVMFLTLTGTLLRLFMERGQTLLNMANILKDLDDPDGFSAPINTEATTAGLPFVRRFFGDDAVRQALRDRRDRGVKYLTSNNYTEKVHIVDLLADCYETEVQSSQLFLAYNMEQLYPFMDEDIIRLSFAFGPQIRYIQGLRYKFPLKKVLEQRSNSPIVRQRKGGSMFHADLHKWMQGGVLREMVQDISLVGSMSRADLDQLIQNPNTLLWHLLAFDIFRKQILRIKD